ncbi:MAG: ankyrin repeat domain-containing protein [Sulfurovaceae bacterium]|nr:ankyrin repeat domain-containing protein [Sulfurovaceae bacterium]
MSEINITTNNENSIIEMIENNIEDIELVKILLNQKENINQVDENLNNLLMLSIKKSYIELSKLLLENGIDINHQNKDGDNALMIALKEGEVESINLLIKYNINLNHQDNKGKNTLILAIELGFLDIAEQLIKGVTLISLIPYIFPKKKLSNY